MLLKCFPRQQRRCLRFQDEISAHMKLRHPHIMRIVDAFAMDRHVVLVFASGTGERLDTYIRQASWPAMPLILLNISCRARVCQRR